MGINEIVQVGTRIKEIRKQKGLTQKRLGERCGINEANIRKYELGIAHPKIETIEKIASGLGVNIVDIYLRMSTWTPVKEVLPGDERYVLVSFGGKSIPAIGYYSGGRWLSDGDSRFYFPVKAWMDLPVDYVDEDDD